MVQRKSSWRSSSRFSAAALKAIGIAMIAVSLLPALIRNAFGDNPFDVAWSQLTLRNAVKGGAAGLIGDKLIYAGGFFDAGGPAQTTIIVQLGPNGIPIPPPGQMKIGGKGPIVPQQRVSWRGVTIDGDFYGYGGRLRSPTGDSFVNDMLRLRFQNGAAGQPRVNWDPAPIFPGLEKWGRAAGAIGNHGSKIVVAGGANRPKKGQPDQFLSTAEWIDVSQAAPVWNKLPPIPGAPRTGLAGSFVGSKFYVFGGYHPIQIGGKPASGRLDEAFVLDFSNPANANWTPIKVMPARLSGMGSVVVDDRYIVFVGGSNLGPINGEGYPGDWSPNQPNFYNCNVFAYDTRLNDYFLLKTRLPDATNGPGVLIKGDLIYAIGGEKATLTNPNTSDSLSIGVVTRGVAKVGK